MLPGVHFTWISPCIPDIDRRIGDGSAAPVQDATAESDPRAGFQITIGDDPVCDGGSPLVKRALNIPGGQSAAILAASNGYGSQECKGSLLHRRKMEM